MTTLDRREERLRMHPWKSVISKRCVSAEAKPAPSGAAGRTLDPNRLKPLQKEVVRLKRELEAESQNGSLG